ncbi:MAG: hypothetical protein ABIS23_07995 [Sphingomicrobium sp.]
MIASLGLGLAACGQVAPLKPGPGRAMPVKPLMASVTPTVDDLLDLPPQAKPRRVDELLTRSQPRRPDRFDLPPADGGAAPTEVEPTDTTPSTTGPDNAREPR